MSSTGRAVLRSLISPLTVAAATLALLVALLAGMVMAAGDSITSTDRVGAAPTTLVTPTPIADADSDGIPDSIDNCPHWPNATQQLPPWSIPASDSDCDGYSGTTFVIQRASEAFLGTDPIDKCADTPTPFDERGPDFGEPLSPWPPDINDDGKTTLTDALRFGLHWSRTPVTVPASI